MAMRSQSSYQVLTLLGVRLVLGVDIGGRVCRHRRNSRGSDRGWRPGICLRLPTVRRLGKLVQSLQDNLYLLTRTNSMVQHGMWDKSPEDMSFEWTIRLKILKYFFFTFLFFNMFFNLTFILVIELLFSLITCKKMCLF